MKRFFQPVPKDGSPSKKRLAGAAEPGDGPTSAGAATGAGGDVEGRPTEEPFKFLTWNANSLLLRMKSDWPAFSQLVARLDPDVICVQEVRMPAAGSKGAPKNPSELKDDTSLSRDEKQVVLRALSASPFKDYRVWWSLSDSKYAGTAMFIKKKFEPKKVSFNLDRTSSKHEADGRVIIAEFESFLLLNTYSPNNGWKEEENAFQRRRKWDKRMLEFVQHVDKPLIWCGDLNVSHEEIDVSHPDFFSSAKLNGYTPPNKEVIFVYAVTHRTVDSQDSPQQRDGVLATYYSSRGKLVDAYRHLHKEKDIDGGFSWSGHPIGKYRGKRMRIDYFLVSEQLKDRIVSCEMHGRGIELDGFYGSDHCPVSLELSEAVAEEAPGQPKPSI
ncbi:DNA-(apurinic or apyrimidinic site) lyase [Zea mays]|uniref:DNA-(apurinic or apyrimidinic site) endonuclease n=1 Tax=Zea mays TaxID=4577 RepID=A0A1D6J140_MAIZE|nr:DNA-(apurinic or apyrimidinic site) lyase [Zea mays]AQK41768.1 DNA-(apurinic or apyrimidinic site) lyase [Zea mays]